MALVEIAPQDACHAAPCLPPVHHPCCEYIVQVPYVSMKGRFEQGCAAVVPPPFLYTQPEAMCVKSWDAVTLLLLLPHR